MMKVSRLLMTVPLAATFSVVAVGVGQSVSKACAMDLKPSTLCLEYDLTITKTNGVSSVTAGTQTTYTIVVTHAGGDPVSTATVTDTMPAGFDGVTWTCVGVGATCTSAGTGDISDAVGSLDSGDTVTYTVTGTVSELAEGTITNDATVFGESGVDTNPQNNGATDVDQVVQPTGGSEDDTPVDEGDGGSGAGLPDAGSNTQWLAAWALGAIALGGSLVAAGRRRVSRSFR